MSEIYDLDVLNDDGNHHAKNVPPNHYRDHTKQRMMEKNSATRALKKDKKKRKNKKRMTYEDELEA
eukprot:CAMPEP_0119564976 /NCGR_PEP_ID=MMETSP1352-20130426/28565_1 /TAXON_ID=265584 /ORGANISM="Stauroneis constricta, Strain CCMP1120" /LENGTH=65 /DNA_ID=CAMNT_0007613797 /DNA_START=80 /DNA_END=273 /DNA_ORIENTATION=-